MPINESNLNNNDEPVGKNFRKGKKQQSSYLNFKNKKVGRLISRKLRNRKSDHLILIITIEVNGQCLDGEINDFLAHEDPKNQCLGKEVVTPIEQYDSVTKLPPCLKGKEGFAVISHDLEQATSKNEVPIVDCIPRRFVITPVHCDNCLDWIELYYRNIFLLQAQVKRLATRNALLQREKLDLKAHTKRENKRFKKTGNIIIKNTTSFKAIINYELSDSSFANF